MSSLSVDVSLALIKAIVSCYDVITYPFYLVVQKPWRRLRASRRPKARPLDPRSPYSAWTRISAQSPTDGHFIQKCRTVDQLFAAAVAHFGRKPCFGERALLDVRDETQADGKVFRKQVLSDYRFYSYEEIDARVQHVAQGLHALGVRRHDNVVVLADTRLQWMLAAQALFRLGATVCTLYATLGDDAVVHGIQETEVTCLITQDDLLPKLGRVWGRLPRVRTVVYMEGARAPDLHALPASVRCESFAAVEALGVGLSAPLEGGDAESTAVLMYTSGSTGVPKAVQISHRNILHAIRAFFTIAHALSAQDVYLGYLPLAHVLELAAELFFFSLGMTVGFGTPLTLTDQSTGLRKGVRGDAALLRPTVMTAVPLVLDRIRKGIREQVDAKGHFSRALFDFAVEYKKFWTRKGFQTPIVDRVVCAKIRATLGGRVRLLAVGSAPLAPETHEFIRTVLNVRLLQGYGLTETTASATLMDLDDLTVGRVGPPLEGVHLKLVDWPEGNYRVQDRPHPRGEIVLGGPSITNGYYKNAELTRDAYRVEDGQTWFYTGDIGEMQTDGSLRIVDRKKDLVKLQFGEYISLGKIEAELKSCPFVDNICCYGNSLHTYLIALIVPNDKQMRALALRLGLPSATPLRDLCLDQRVQREVEAAVQAFGRKSRLSRTEIPSKLLLVSDEWLPDSGLVTAALKLRRKKIQEFYQMDIDRLYACADSKST